MRSLMVFCAALIGGIAAIIVTSILISKVLDPNLGLLGTYGVILASAIWAAVDSERVSLTDYKSGIAYYRVPLDHRIPLVCHAARSDPQRASNSGRKGRRDATINLNPEEPHPYFPHIRSPQCPSSP